MKKNLALLLAVVLVFTSMLGLSVSATEADAPVIYTTVPMRATVSILYAVKADREVELVATKADGEPETLTSFKNENGVYYFEYSNLSAAEMETKVTVYVAGHQDSAVSYSVADFLNAYIAKHTVDDVVDTNGTLAQKMLDYGTAVYNYKNPPVAE